MSIGEAQVRHIKSLGGGTYIGWVRNAKKMGGIVETSIRNKVWRHRANIEGWRCKLKE